MSHSDFVTKIDSFENIIFDFDGTIAHLEIDWIKWHDGVEEIFKKYEPDFVKSSAYLHTLQNEYIKKYGKPIRDDLAMFNEEYEERFVTNIYPNRLLIDFIQSNSQKNCCILTLQSKKTILNALEKIDLANHFQQIVSREDVMFIKPDPEGLNVITGNKNKEEYIFVGDAQTDMLAAKNAGIHFQYANSF